MDGLYVCAPVNWTSECGMTAAGAKSVASQVARNPLLETLLISGELACIGTGGRWGCLYYAALRVGREP